MMTQGRGVEGVWNGALAALAVLLGVAAVAAPFLVTLVRNLERERIARAHETVLDLVCRLLLEKKTNHMTS